ncbi:pyocin knob domain-containing protein, partial [Lactococcus petauri]|uniref:pyocin knob domain-containing protein n=1 Tax=Lactococcus petauri TaxID=1940789 RepID=UPI0032E4C3D8
VVRNDILFELQLATISVKMNATQITNADITDMRSDSTVCGWSTPFDNINVDGIVDQYTSIFEQADSDFKSWFQNLKNQLDDNQAANLQNQINNSIHDGGQIPVGTDLDLFINPGFYAASGRIPDTELINYPEGIKLSGSGSGSGTIYAQIVVFKNASSSMVKQVFYDQQSAVEYTRSYANNTWQPWQKVKTNKGDTPWEDVEVMNGFTSGTFPLQYRIYNGNIYLRGRINTVTTKAGVMVQFGKIPITISNQHEWYGGVISTTNQVRMILAPTGALTLVATADMGNNFQISGFDTNFLID